MSLNHYPMKTVLAISILLLAAIAGCQKQSDSAKDGPTAQSKQVIVDVTGMT